MPAQNSLVDLKKFFEFDDIKAFKAEWDQLSEEDKQWFKEQPLS